MYPMTIYRSDSDKALRHQKSLQQGIVDWSSPFLIVSLLLAIGYFVTNQGALGILAILLFAKEAYFRPITPTHAASVEIELHEASFIYRELNSSYQLTIDYDRVKSVQI